MKESELKPLSQIPEGRQVVIERIDAGFGLNSRLAAMGLLPRVRIKVINNHHPGPFVVELRGARTALGRGMANKITVSEV